MGRFSLAGVLTTLALIANFAQAQDTPVAPALEGQAVPAPLQTTKAVDAIVVMLQGKPHAQKGKLTYDRPAVGDVLKTDEKTGEFIIPKASGPGVFVADEKTKRELERNAPLDEGDVITTGPTEMLQVLFATNALLEISPKTTVKINALNITDIKLELFDGQVHIKNANQLTELATAGPFFAIRGQEFTATVRHAAEEAEDKRVRVRVYFTKAEGTVDVIRYTPQGLVYQHPFHARPGLAFESLVRAGFAEEYGFEPIRKPVRQIPRIVAFTEPLELTTGFMPGTMEKRVIAKLMPSKGRAIASGNSPYIEAFQPPQNFAREASPRPGEGDLPIGRIPSPAFQIPGF